MSFSTKALLVSIKMSCWTGRKYDKRATASAQTAHNADNDSGNFTKKLLPDSKSLAKVIRLQSAIRKFLYKNSLPWAMEGSRIIASKEYLNFVSDFRQLKNDLDLAVEEFVIEYPGDKAKAKAKLGDLFNESEYPRVERLARKFDAAIVISPVPTIGDFRVELDQESKAIFEQQQIEAQANATKNCWSRLLEVVSKAAQTLSNPNANNLNPSLNNIVKTCDLLSKLNIADDLDLERLRKEISDATNAISPGLCRENSEERDKAAQTLKEIKAKLGAFAPQGGDND